MLLRCCNGLLSMKLELIMGASIKFRRCSRFPELNCLPNWPESETLD